MKRAVESTLFNKLAGRRIAITEDTPGVTRDRIYAEAEWQNRYFTLVDTGGLDTKSEDVFMSSIREQVEVAISMSDVILFVVDGREGLTSEDRKIAELLRNRQKEVILVVNKIDNRDLIDNFYEFYQLGFENTIDISAEGSRKLGDLLDLITDKFPTDNEIDDMIFAWKVAKHISSNGVVIAKDNATLGIGLGEVNRFWAVEKAIQRAGKEAKGAVLASDGFFPFKDSIEVIGKAGIASIIQPGGSIKDDEVVKEANRSQIKMVFTDIRHFRH